MVYWWGIDLYLNIEQIKIRDIENMISAYSLSGSFGFRVRSKSIGHNTYTGIISNLRSKPTPIYGPVHKSGLNYLYSRIHFSRLPHSVARKPINSFFQKVIYASKIIDPVIDEFIPNDE